MVTNESFGTFSFYSSSSASYGLPYLSKCGAETQSAIASRYVQEVDVAVRRQWQSFKNGTNLRHNANRYSQTFGLN